MGVYFEISVVVLLAVILLIELKRYQAVKKQAQQTTTIQTSGVEQSTKTNAQKFGCSFLHEHMEEEISKLRRYNTYTLTLMDFSVNVDAEDVAAKLKEFIRKSDRVYTCQNKIYLFFPFTRYNSSLKEKIENRVLTHLQGEYEKEVKFITTKFYGFKYDPELKEEEFPTIG